MKSASIFATTVAVVGFSLSGVAVHSAYAVDSATAAVSCADFAKMSAADQDAEFKAVQASMPPANTSGIKAQNAGDKSTPTMSVGLLLSACQADPSDTVHSAVEKATAGTSN